MIKICIIFCFGGLKSTCRVQIYERFLHFISSFDAFFLTGNLHCGLHLICIQINYCKRFCSSTWLIPALWLISGPQSALRSPRGLKHVEYVERFDIWGGQIEEVGRNVLTCRRAFNAHLHSIVIHIQLLMIVIHFQKRPVLRLFYATGVYCVATKQESSLKPSPQNISLTSSSSLCPVFVCFRSLRCYSISWWVATEILWQAESSVNVNLWTWSVDKDCSRGMISRWQILNCLLR